MNPSQLNIGTNPPPPPSNNSNSGPAVDLFGNSGGDLFQTPIAPTASAAQNNLLGDLLSPSRPAASQPAAPAKSASEQMVDDMLNQLGGANLSNSNQQQQQQQKQGRPNYNSAFFKVQTVLLFWRPKVSTNKFQEPKKPSVGGGLGGAASKPASSANFDDLLSSQGFTSSSSSSVGFI